jgi:lysine-ketoglutarate reductase/saccharopine dehydrogenase-like protein (TIGR00300 family)
MSNRPRVLMCEPSHFGVEYVINPWMQGQVGQASATRARAQWQELESLIEELADVELIPPGPGLPDMCFTANGGMVFGSKFVPARFSVSQRALEADRHRAWFAEQGFEIVELEGAHAFEGEGDALWWPGPGSPPVVFAGYGVRSDLEAHRELADGVGCDVVSLRLVDERFYHLDTCFLPLPNGRLMYFREAFDADSLSEIEARTRPDDRLEVDAEDALRFACNAVRISDTMIMNHASARLRGQLAAWGYQVRTTPLDEFLKAGGAAKCLTLLLQQDEYSPEIPHSPSPICTTTVSMTGHLLDDHALTAALEVIAGFGGSFDVEQFRAGERRDQLSTARIRIAATRQERLAAILQGLEAFAVEQVDATRPVTVSQVQQVGVAPDGFYCTTIYPTEVHHRDRWLKVDSQRMDSVIVIDAEGREARCVLIRDLSLGDLVVCSEEGVRVRTPDLRKTQREFSFMSSGVSSERRAEGLISEVALEMKRVRARGGKTVVVAGPVVIHTGGGPHLAELIRNGFVSALLTGNALPVHDIETSLFGTSLGVDLAGGVGVSGGHQHHLRAINAVRTAGSIEAAVRSGIVTGGVMYECVEAGIPYVLAGSIRDDGPLPETLMDLVDAQSAYAEAIEGADLILMLSSMLHAIGTGNMTPAGVHMVCVDISPAVVTKLADRGSVESTGIVTDVGLFMNVLARQLLD